MIYPVPKPKPKVRGKRGAPTGRPRTRLKRTRMKQVNRKRGGSAFPKQRDAKYRKWIRTENLCMIAGRIVLERLGLHDKSVRVDNWTYAQTIAWRHVCWGDITPAHVGEHQARGAPDFGVIVPLCEAAHDFYDHHRSKWQGVTGWTEPSMASAASGYALKYVERGGWVDRGGAP